MSRAPVDPLAQSIHERLLNVAHRVKEDFNSILSRYAVERLLYRLSRSKHAARFTLKGAMLFVLWMGRIHRPTRDLDLLGGGKLDAEKLKSMFEAICQTAVEPDGLAFDPGSITVEEIREGELYHGHRLKIRGRLGNARVTVQVDVGIGDAVTPPPEEVDFPVLLDLPAPHLKAYPREVAIAEKIDAMIELGQKNSRMKDFYDIWVLCRRFAFDGRALCLAFNATRRRRGRPIPSEIPLALTEDFPADALKQKQWKAFLSRHRLGEDAENLDSVIACLRNFLTEPILAAQTPESFKRHWPVGGPWKEGVR